MKRIFILALGFIICSNGLLLAQNTFPNTIFQEEGKDSPAADLNDIVWLAGHWQGEAFGGLTEEIWTPALGGSMMGSFKLVNDGEVSFYEFMSITEVNNSLILKIKHFTKELKGWEEKDETVDFKLVKVTPNRVYFEGFTMEKISKSEINLYVVIDHDGKKEEVKFPYQKVD